MAGDSDVSFRVASVLKLPFENGDFDRIIATQLLLHVPDPWKALAEMNRVLAPGGMIPVTEIDWGTPVVECTNRDLSRRFTELACNEPRPGFFAVFGSRAHMTVVVGAPMLNNRDELYIAAFAILPDGPTLIYTKEYLHTGEEQTFAPGSGGPALLIGDTKGGLGDLRRHNTLAAPSGPSR